MLVNAQTVIAGGETDQASEKTAVNSETDEDQHGKDSLESTFDTVSNVVLSPAHYAILLGGKLLPLFGPFPDPLI